MTEQEEKKTRGWYGQRVKEISDEFAALQDEFQELKNDMSYKELTKLANHPLFEKFDNFEQRFRRVEQNLETILTRMQHFESRITAAENTVRSLSTPARRGA